MTKLQFLFALRDRLSGIPHDDAEERLSFYSEMIEDRMEEGLSEEDAVASIGSVEELAAQIAADYASAKTEKAPNMAKAKKRLKAWEIVLLALGSPIWLSLLIAAFAVLFSLVVSLWAVIVSLWAVFVSFAGCAFGFLLGGIVLALLGKSLSGIAVIAAAFVCAGLSIFWFFGCRAATKGSILLTKKIVLWTKALFTKKEDA